MSQTPLSPSAVYTFYTRCTTRPPLNRRTKFFVYTMSAMKDLSISPLLLVIVLVLGSVGAAATITLLSPEPVVEVVSEAGPDEDLLAQLDALRAENAALGERISDLELRPVPSERVSASDTSEFEDEVRAWMEQMEKGDEASPVALQSKVENALTSIREQEALQKQQIKNQRREEWGWSVIEKFAPDLGLTQIQTEEMGRTWIAKSAMDDELGRLWEAGEIPREEIGQIKEANEVQHQANLQGFLSAQQYEDYTAMVRSWRGGDK